MLKAFFLTIYTVKNPNSIYSEYRCGSQLLETNFFMLLWISGSDIHP